VLQASFSRLQNPIATYFHSKLILCLGLAGPLSARLIKQKLIWYWYLACRRHFQGYKKIHNAFMYAYNNNFTFLHDRPCRRLIFFSRLKTQVAIYYRDKSGMWIHVFQGCKLPSNSHIDTLHQVSGRCITTIHLTFMPDTQTMVQTPFQGYKKPRILQGRTLMFGTFVSVDSL
jgi:hypothetical protein